MGLTGVLKNVRKKGIKGTIAVFKERQALRKAEQKELEQADAINRIRLEYLKMKAEELQKEELSAVKNCTSLDEAVSIYIDAKSKEAYGVLADSVKIVYLKRLAIEFCQMDLAEEYSVKFSAIENCTTIDEIQSILNSLEENPPKYFTKLLKKYYIKHILPEVYEMFAKLPMEKKTVFMQPRQGLNGSCRVIFEELRRQDEYPPYLFELHRDTLGKFSYFENAEQFIREMAVSKGVFVHESNELFGYLNIRPESKVIQLWHGCGILKHIGLDTAGKPGFKSVKAYKEYPEYNKYSIVTIASPELTWVFEQFMGLKAEDGVIQPIGVSRTDEFFSQEYIDNCYEKLYEAIPAAKDKKVILYAPTYRGLDPNREAPTDLDVAKFAEALSDEYILIYKHHQTVKELPAIPEPYNETFAFDMTRGRGMNINELMTVSDICISDYSSLVFEYALFERPIIFYAFDLDTYIDNRGLYYDYEKDITPGPVCKTNEEMIDYILNIDERFNKQEVTDFKNKFMSSCDGHATERIIEFMKK